MNATITKAWDEGTGNVYVNYSGSGNGTIVVTSDNNDLTATRTMTLTIKTTSGSPTTTRTVTITQEASKLVPTITIQNGSRAYNSQVYSPTIYYDGDGTMTITYYQNGSALQSAPIDAGTYNIVVTTSETDDYFAGRAESTFTITKMQISTSLTPQTYDGSNKWPSNTVYVTYTGAGNVVNAGTYQVTASLNDTANTEWSDHTTADKTLTLTINAANISSATITGIDASYDYTGIAITPIPTVTFSGSTLVQNTDYTLSYSDNTDVGTATITITGIGNFTDTAYKSFAIVQPEPTVFTLADPDCGAKWFNVSESSYSLETLPHIYDGNRKAIGYIKSGKTITQLLQLFSNNYDKITVFDKNGIVVNKPKWSSTTITTGMSIMLVENNLIHDFVYIVIFGDLNMDGLVNSSDLAILKRYIRGMVNLSYESLIAADINHDYDVNTSDVSNWPSDLTTYEQDFA